MDVAEALARLKFLVRHNKFKMVRRTDKMAMPVSVPLAKELIRQLSIDILLSMNLIVTIHYNLYGYLKLLMSRNTI